MADKNNEKDRKFIPPKEEENTKEVSQPKKEEVIDLDKEVLVERALLREIRQIAGKLGNRIGSFLKQITDIRTGMDEDQTSNSIRKNVTMKGSNVWLLMSAIMVASLGLNLNSPAVIIGAMLISPLMSPILGVGLSISINDRKLLSHSLNNFAIAIVVSLATSALFFAFTPFKGPTPEILARTSPSLLDIMVAFFGGIAGIVSGSRKEQSNAIPGVAIATALLPPLCVSGYGLVRGDWSIMFNSFYLFFLNCVFIATATYIVVRWVLRFDFYDYVNLKEQRRTRLMMIVFVVLVSIPSVIFLRNQMQEVNYKNNVKRFVEAKFEDPQSEYSYTLETFEPRGQLGKDSTILKVTLYSTNALKKEYIEAYRLDMPDYDIKNTRMQVIQINSPKPDQSQTLLAINNARQQDIDKLLEQIKVEQQEVGKREKVIARLESILDSIYRMESPLIELEDEVISLYPELQQIGFAEIQQTDMDSVSIKIPTVLVKWDNRKINRYNQRTNEQRIGDWIKVRLDLDTIQVLRY